MAALDRLPTDSEQFQHSPLPDDSKCIRLLSVGSREPGRNADMQYILSSWLFEDAPPYHAISYTWGPPDQQASIVLNGRSKSIRKNCAEVLELMAYFMTAQYYWIDTLCIDQDSVDEKSAQVAIMGSIYIKAEQVLACVGMGGDEDMEELGLQLLLRYDREVASERTLTYRQYLGNRDMSEYWGLRRRFRVWSSSIPPKDVLRLWLACHRIAKREYFSRVWTTPEFLLAKDVAIYFGRLRVRWQAACEILDILSTHYSGVLGIFEESGMSLIIRNGELAQRDVEQLERDRASYQAEERLKNLFDQKRVWTYRGDEELPGRQRRSVDLLTMSDAIGAIHQRSCSDPRDTIFAMLPLVDQHETIGISPDYTRTAYHLGVTVLERHDISEEHSVQLIENLQLCRKTAEVEAAVQQRAMLSRDVPSLCQPTPPHETPSRSFRVAGRQLRPDAEFRLEEPTQDGTVHSVLFNKTGEHIGLTCASTRPGDWLLKLLWLVEDYNYNFNPHNLVARRVEDRFAIIGLAKVGYWLEDTWYELPGQPPVGYTRFRAYFDARDYLTYLASMKYPAENWHGTAKDFSDSDRLNVSFCGAPFSSYAELVDREFDNVKSLLL